MAKKKEFTGFKVTTESVSTPLAEWIEEHVTPTYDYISGVDFLYDCGHILEHIVECKIEGLKDKLTKEDIRILNSATYIEL